jgi:hypothetical protein
VLGSRFLRCESAAEEQVLMQQLGVHRIEMSSFLQDPLALKPLQLQAGAVEATVLYVVQHLQQLTAQGDPALPSILG